MCSSSSLSSSSLCSVIKLYHKYDDDASPFTQDGFEGVKCDKSTTEDRWVAAVCCAFRVFALTWVWRVGKLRHRVCGVWFAVFVTSATQGHHQWCWKHLASSLECSCSTVCYGDVIDDAALATAVVSAASVAASTAPALRKVENIYTRYARRLQLLSIDHFDHHYPEQTELPKSLSQCAKQNLNNAKTLITDINDKG